MGGKGTVIWGRARLAAVFVLLAALGALAPSQAAARAPLCTAQTPFPNAEYRFQGDFDSSLQKGYVLLPFDVPADTTAVRVHYCHDQPDLPTGGQIQHTLDLGLYDARSGPEDLWDEDEFRGWGGSSHPDVTVSPEGFSTEDQYKQNNSGGPRVPGKTTRGFEPGPIPSGEWAVELGVAAVASQSEGDADGKVAWRVEVELSSDPSFADDRYVPAPYNASPANEDAGWYAGDFHVHAEHSSLGDATMRETFDYAFAPLGTGAGLDFITLSDYVTDSAWGEIGRYQADYSKKLIIRSSEIITYFGHANNHASATFVDYRTGPIYERQPDGTLDRKRLGCRTDPPNPASCPASQIFPAVHEAGGFTQINHPTIFPSDVPAFSFMCRGCPWDYSADDTDYSKVDAIEIATGPAGLQQFPEPGPNPFTSTAIRFWEDAIDSGSRNRNKIAAVGSSDSHKAGCQRLSCDPVTQTPIGVATTVVYAEDLSEKGIQHGVEAGHTYVKVFGNDGPDLDFEAGVAGSAARAIIGDTVHADSVVFTAKVRELNRARAARPGDYEVFVFKDGAPFLSRPIPPPDPTADPAENDKFEFEFPGLLPGRYRLQVQRDSAIEAVSSPIYLEPAAPADLSLTKSDSPDPAFVGGALAYTLTTRNDGPSNAAGVTVTDELPDGLSFGSATPSQGSCSEDSGTVSCRLGNLAPGGAATIAITVTPLAAGTVTNTARVEAVESDPNSANNSDAETTTLKVAGCHGRQATIIGTQASETLTGTAGDDVIVGLAGNDTISGGEGNDRICSGAGRDTIAGGEGNDVMSGQSGPDTFNGNGGTDRVSYQTRTLGVTVDIDNVADDGNSLDGAGARDNIRTDIESLTGGDGDDALTGSDVNNAIRGELGADSLIGLDGNDRLYADDGTADVLIDCDGGPADRARVDPQDPTPIGCEFFVP